MMRSLYSGVSGLRNNQTKMDVIGNNIANVNTTSFKKGRVTFKDMLSQTVQGASAPTASQGGTDPMQVGLGVTLGTIDTVMAQGSAQTTGKNTDLMIQGDGFFILSNGGREIFSRSGNFDPDQAGYLSDLASGSRVLGYLYDAAQDPIDYTNAPLSPIQMVKGAAFPGTQPGDPNYVGVLDTISIDKTGTITGTYVDSSTNTTVARKIAQIAIATFANPQGLNKEGDNAYSVSNNSGVASIGVAGVDGKGQIIPGALEMSNVDLSQEFTDMIVAQRGFEANSRIITVSDTMLEDLINLKRS